MGEQRDPQTYAMIGAGMYVHSELGCGFVELPYQEAMLVEMRFRSIPFVREPSLPIHYRGEPLPCTYEPDFICYGEVILELKAVETLTDRHRSQVINYLKASKLQRALLMNFGAEKLEYERIVLNYTG
ncbi:MAG: GxxExxY protein [Candidatus Hydrogenedentes bacterium]|nr:GxxExxY protein [Candidatus Hydrogenedentota bacterium]